MSVSTGSSLLLRVREQQSQAWTELVDLYGPLVAHWCHRCGLDCHATADCVQEVFAAVARSIHGYRSERKTGSFRAWLWTITRNKVRDFQRAGRRHPLAQGGSSAFNRLQQIPDPGELELPDNEPSSESEIQALMARGLEQVRSEFEPRTWAIFTRCVIDQIDTACVADQFGIQPASVRQIRSRVLRRLREQLGDIEH